MSRSRKKSNYVSFAVAESEKQDKKIANKKLRLRVKELIRSGKYDSIPDIKEVSDNWLFAKDGRYYYKDIEESSKRK